jgi:hypothetical protein
VQIRKTVKKIIRDLDKSSPWPVFYHFIMTPEERSLFDKTIKHSKAYLEFGTGGSTIRALKKSKAKIYSVDSSAEWIRSLRKYFLVRYMEKKRLLLLHMDIGPTKEWGYPVSMNLKERFLAYSSGVFSLIKKETLDTVLIDGRFRVACALKTILECYTNAGLTILVHDFWNREEYRILLNYLSEMDRAGTLGAFAIKKDIDLAAARNDYELYKYNPA